MAGWDINWEDTEAFEKRPFNVFKQLVEALTERFNVISAGTKPAVATRWDSTKSYSKWAWEWVVKDYTDRGVWNSGTTYSKYDKVSKYTAKGEWDKAVAYKKYEHVAFTVGTVVSKWVANQNNTGKPPVVLDWDGAKEYFINDYVLRTNLSITKTYIAIAGSTGKDPLTEPTYWTEVIYDPLTYWWTYAEAPHRYFFAKVASTNKDPYTETAYWAVDGALDVPPNVFRSNFVDGNQNKDPFTETTYWTAWWPWDLEHYYYILLPEGVPSLPRALPSPSPVKSWLQAFQAYMTGIFQYWANHTYNGGDLNGGEITDVTWNENAMMVAIGDAETWSGATAYEIGDYAIRSGTSYRAILAGTNKDPLTEPTYWTVDSARIPAPTSMKQIRAWAWQQYRMINMLRWGLIQPRVKVGPDEDTGTRERRFGSGSGSTWPIAYANALANYNAASWALVPGLYYLRWPSWSYAYCAKSTSFSCQLSNLRGYPEYKYTNGLPGKYYVFFISRAYYDRTDAAHHFASGDGFSDMHVYEWGRDLVERTIGTGDIVFQAQIEQAVQPQGDPPVDTITWRESKARISQSEFFPETSDGAWARFVIRGDSPNGFEYKDW